MRLSQLPRGLLGLSLGLSIVIAPLPAVAATTVAATTATTVAMTAAPAAAKSKATAAPPPATPAPASDEDAEAKQLFAARKYPEAAVAFEQLFNATGGAKHLFNAAMARELAGHEGHAYLLLRRYLAIPDLQPAESDRAKDRLAALQRRTASIRIVALPGQAAPTPRPAPLTTRGLQITLERTATGAVGDAGRAPLVLEGDTLSILVSHDVPDAFDMFVEQGPWVVSARADGYETMRQDVEVSNGQAQVSLTLPELPPPPIAFTAEFTPADAVTRGIDVTLTRDGQPPRNESVRQSPVTWQLAPGSYQYLARAPGYFPREGAFEVSDKSDPKASFALTPEPTTPPPNTKKKLRADAWVIGLGAAGGGTVILGAVLLGVSGSQWNKTLDRYAQYAGNDAINWDVASGNLMKSWTTYGAGAGLVGGGVGLGLGALGMYIAPRLDKPRSMWIAGAAVGGVLTLGGALLVGRAGTGMQATQWDHANNFSTLDLTAADAYGNKRHDVGATAALLGFGAGLALSSILGLARKTPSKNAALLPTGTGLVLTGRF